MMLGVGWNFIYIGGTTLLTTTYTPAEKGRAQATNDMTIFAVGLACSFSAGALLQFSDGRPSTRFCCRGWSAVALIWLGYRHPPASSQ